jgi:prepilin-type N-terminal cleavage/methylation domain-containing protein
MGTQGIRGFTIIETMLVLAITGLLVAGVFVGVGTQIGVQRYRDAVETFKTTVQNQFVELNSVQNDRSDTWDCSDQAETIDTGSTVRGQSDCILIGRIMSIEAGSIRTASVVARAIATPDESLNDIDSLRDNYILNIASNTQRDAVMEWGTEIAWPQQGGESRNPTTPRELSLLIVRSPDSGQIYSFTNDTFTENPTPDFLRTMLNAGSGDSGGQRERIICISSDDVAISDDYSLVIAPFASVPNAVETSSNVLFEEFDRVDRC